MELIVITDGDGKFLGPTLKERPAYVSGQPFVFADRVAAEEFLLHAGRPKGETWEVGTL